MEIEKFHSLRTFPSILRSLSALAAAAAVAAFACVVGAALGDEEDEEVAKFDCPG